MGGAIFVSSTCYDLIDTRREVEEHLRALGLRPMLSDRATSDFEVSGTEHSIETCLVNVRACDVFVCILSQRYGPTLERFNYPGKSATHVEYDVARGAGKDVRVYGRDQLVAEHGAWRRDKEAWRKNKSRWVKDEALLDFFDAHSAPPVGGGTNWYTPFRDSFELKQILSRDLRASSRPALLRRLIDAGKVPYVTLQATSFSSVAGGGVRVEFRVTAAGAYPALRATLVARAPFFPVERELGDLTATSTKTSVQVEKQADTAGELELTYETEHGNTIRDTLAATYLAPANGHNGRFSAKLKRRELLDDAYELR